MSGAEVRDIHTRLLKCALELDDSRAYWRHTTPGVAPSPHQAFEEYWFGARSLARIKVLLTNFRARFDAFPSALRTLHRWSDMDPDTRKLICHWHLQLADPLYRAFTGTYLVARRSGLRVNVTRDLVIAWVAEQGPERWTMTTRIQFASKLLSAAYASGIVTTNRDPRPLAFPRVADNALTYLLYLLREASFEGSLAENPYLSSVGLTNGFLEERVRALPALQFHRQGDLLDFNWQFGSVEEWAAGVGLLRTEGASA